MRYISSCFPVLKKKLFSGEAEIGRAGLPPSEGIERRAPRPSRSPGPRGQTAAGGGLVQDPRGIEARVQVVEAEADAVAVRSVDPRTGENGFSEGIKDAVDAAEDARLGDPPSGTSWLPRIRPLEKSQRTGAPYSQFSTTFCVQVSIY